MADSNFDQVFSELTEDERAVLLGKAQTFTFASGDVIISEDSNPDAIFVITKGKARVTKGISSTLSADFAGPHGLGEVIGEMSFVDGCGASATLVADGDVEALRLAHGDLREMTEADPAFAGRLYHSLLLVLIRRLRVVNTRILLPFF